MTREEKKKELIALFATGAMPIGELIDDCFAFADANPHWISVEDEFPPFDFKNDGTWKCSDNVLIYSPLRGIFVGRYECDDMAGKTYWLFGGAKLPTVEDTGEGYCLTNVTHWMPLPAIEGIRGNQGKISTNRIIGTEEHIKVALDVIDKKGGEE